MTLKAETTEAFLLQRDVVNVNTIHFRFPSLHPLRFVLHHIFVDACALAEILLTEREREIQATT